jgi:predicted Fe-Mo cluster-binding NifX family protein
VDPRFGRAQWIITVDTETGDHEAHDNTINLNIPQGAGIQTAKNVADLQVTAVVTGNVGPKAYRTLAAAGIQVYLAGNQTVQQAIEALKKGTLQQVSQANVEGHWV